jgi:hypothetical protein
MGAMKISTSASPPQPQRDDANKTASRKTVGPEAADTEDPGASSTGATGRDFASVLEEVTRPRERAADFENDGGDTSDATSRERAESGPETRRREGRRDEGRESDAKGGGFEQRASVREAALVQDEALSARSILHIADLERIVSAVRAQTLADGVRQVTVELRRSVLEGLRVKLSLDARGRVDAEFIAASERVRAQLDSRANELSELLRSRGVNLAGLRTTVGADLADGTAAESDRNFNAPEEAARVTTSIAATTAAGADDVAREETAADETSKTYRA